MEGLAVGRIVHLATNRYRLNEEPEEVCLAAIVTSVNDGPGRHVGIASLHVFDADGLRGTGATARFDERKIPGTWHWPERA